MKRLRLRYALVALATALPAACDDADTIIAVWNPDQPAPPLEAGTDAPMEADLPDAPEPPDGGEGGSGADAGDGAAPQPTAFFLEAESGVLSGPFMVGTSDGASGGAFITASEAAATGTEPGTARSVYDFTLAEGGDYKIWGRIHSPGPSSNRFWFRLDEGQWFLWRISTGEAWFWDDFHDNLSYNEALSFTLAAGAHRLELANAVLGSELDRLYITARNDHPLEITTPCSPPHSIEIAGECIRSCGSYGMVTCGDEACMGLTPLVAYDCTVCCLQP